MSFFENVSVENVAAVSIVSIVVFVACRAIGIRFPFLQPRESIFWADEPVHPDEVHPDLR